MVHVGLHLFLGRPFRAIVPDINPSARWTFKSAMKSRGSCMTGRTTDTLFLRADGLARRSLRVVLELEVAAFPRLDFVITIIHAEVNSCYHKKETRPAEDDWHGHADRPPLTGRAPGSLG